MASHFTVPIAWIGTKTNLDSLNHTPALLPKRYVLFLSVTFSLMVWPLSNEAVCSYTLYYLKAIIDHQVDPELLLAALTVL